jgi:site-specific DNA-methyltransferase (adenine-specific)
MKPYYSDPYITIFHADALDVLANAEELALMLGGGFDCVSTDPPYSSGGAFRGDRVQKTSAKYVNSSTQAHRPEFSGDQRDQRSFEFWCVMWLRLAWHACNPDAYLSTFIDWRQLPTMTDAVQAGGWIWQGVHPWVKPSARPRPDGFSQSSEFMVWGSRNPMGERDNKTARYPTGYVEESSPRDREHIAEKPEKVARWQLSLVKPLGLVLDPFMGSGTTLRAAKDLGLRAVGIDCDEHSCEIAARRMAQGVLL